MKKAEYQENLSCLQRDSAEHEGYVGAQSVGGQEGKEQDGADLLERILSRGNLNNAYKRVRANKGAPGIDGMTVEDALPWLREHREELLDMIRQGKYKPQPVRRKEIPKPDGGVRKLGIPTVVDRIIQQAIAQQLTPIYEPLFSDLSYGYRPGRSAQDAILKVKEYAEKGYTQAVLVDLSKYFDTLNHELLMNLLRKNIHDKRVIELIKRYLKAGVMENGLLVKTEEGSPQGGPLSPLLANIYLNEYDQEMVRRGVPVIRYADDIVVLAKSKRAAERLLETTKRYLEGKLKLKMNVEKSKVVSVFAIRNFKFLGFALGKRSYPFILLMLVLPYHPAERPVPVPEGFDGTYYPEGMETVPRRYAIVRANRKMVENVDWLIAYVCHLASNSRSILNMRSAVRKQDKSIL